LNAPFPIDKARENIVTVLCNCLCPVCLCLIVSPLLTHTQNRLAEDGGAEAARETAARGIGGHRQQARRAGPSLGQSRKGVSWRLCGKPFFSGPNLFVVVAFDDRIEEDDLIQREVHNADLSNHDRGCIIQ